MGSKYGACLAALVAVLALSAFAATAAMASEGPSWINKHGALESSKATTQKNVGSVTLTSFLSMTCTAETATGTLLASDPGEGATSITFSGCTETGKSGCTITGVGISKGSGVGVIDMSVLTGLMYPAGKAKATEKALDAYFPTGSSGLLAEIELANNAACATLKGKLYKLTASGKGVALAQLPGTTKEKERPCGLLSEVGALKSNAFAATKAGELVTEGALNLPTTPIASGEWSEGKTFKSVSCSIELDGSPASLTGTTEVSTSPLEEIGWTNS
jgi:hypothetical protein